MKGKNKFGLLISFIIPIFFIISCTHDNNGTNNDNNIFEYKIKSLEKIAEGAFPKWSRDGSLIAFTKEVSDPNDQHGIGFQIYTMKPDGSNIKCLTCNKSGLSNARWRGQPYWHPSGEYIVFTAGNRRV